ncbi:hypothetical protein [Streptomyces sp. NPDC012466]|uniref:hypothetical protein n=1 Tax=Streptomyces sp. NPDC012466 TaxID=3364835 RepID=UPI0036E6D9FD
MAAPARPPQRELSERRPELDAIRMPVVGVPADRHRGNRVTTPTRTRRRRIHGHLSAAALPLYVLHQPIVVAVASLVVGWALPILVEYAGLVTISPLLTPTA